MAAMIVKQDGVHIDTKDRFIVMDGRSYTIPKHVRCNNVTTINGKIYMGGYEFQDGEWKKTLKALYHYFF